MQFRNIRPRCNFLFFFGLQLFYIASYMQRTLLCNCTTNLSSSKLVPYFRVEFIENNTATNSYFSFSLCKFSWPRMQQLVPTDQQVGGNWIHLWKRRRKFTFISELYGDVAFHFLLEELFPYNSVSFIDNSFLLNLKHSNVLSLGAL